MSTSLIKGLGGTAASGDATLVRTDDGSVSVIDRAPVLPARPNIFARRVTGLVGTEPVFA